MNKRTFLSFSPLYALLLFFFLINHVHAMGSGIYLGILGGPASNSGSTQLVQTENPDILSIATPKKNLFGVRVFWGYLVNNYFGFENGFDYFSRINYSTAGPIPPCGNPVAKVKGVDLVAKGQYPFNVSKVTFAAFVKGGLMYSLMSFSGCFHILPTGNCGSSTKQNVVKPLVALGVSYDLGQNWQAELSWSRYFLGSLPKAINLLALGVSFHFVDRYCGQFLCDSNDD
jgi:hypothetical protein